MFFTQPRFQYSLPILLGLSGAEEGISWERGWLRETRKIKKERKHSARKSKILYLIQI